MNLTKLSMLAILAARYLAGRRLRTSLTTLAVVFGVAVIFGINGLIPTFLDVFDRSVQAATGVVDISISHSTGEAFDTTVLDRLRALPGVKAASGVLSRIVTEPAGSSVTTFQIVGLVPADALAVRVYPITAGGRFLTPDDAGQSVTVIDQGLAEMGTLAVGDTLSVPTMHGTLTLRIVGLTDNPVVPGQAFAYVALDLAQTAFDQTGRMNVVELALTAEADGQAVERAAIAAAGTGFRGGGLRSDSDIFASLQAAQIIMNLFGVLALFMGGFLIFNTFRTSVAERRRDLGILRTIGANRSTLIALVLWESVWQGVLGTLGGLALGYLFALGLLAVGGAQIQNFIRIEFPRTPVYTPTTVFAAIALGMATTLIAGLWPALDAARLTPLEALHPAPQDATVRETQRGAQFGTGLLVLALLGLLSGQVAALTPSTLLFLVGLILITPALVSPLARLYGRVLILVFPRESALAQANFQRQPGRAAITASALMIGLSIVVMVSAVMSSFKTTFSNVLVHSIPADYLILPPNVSVWNTDIGAGPELHDTLAKIPGVQGVATLRFALGTLPNPTTGVTQSISVLALDPVEYRAVAGFDFQSGDPDQAYAALASGTSALVNSVTARQLNVNIGDTIQVESTSGLHTYTVAAIANDYLMAKVFTLYISQDALQKDFGRTEDILLQVRRTPDADPAAVQTAIKRTLKPYSQFKLLDADIWRTEQTRILTGALAVLNLIALALALPAVLGLLNTLAINVLERLREIGMLRAIGATRGQVRRLILSESLLLAAFGTAGGILTGLWLSYVAVIGLRNGLGYALEYNVPASGVLLAVLGGLLAGVLAAVIPARQAANVPIVEALQYE